MKIRECSTWLDIDLGAIANNVAQLHQICGRPVIAVVKANGYGHGMVEAARAALKGGAAWLAVARLEEALVLRAAGISANILLMGYTPPERIVLAATENIRVTVYDAGVIEAYAAQLSAAGMTIHVHLKVDSGMGRLGIAPEDGAVFLRWLNEKRQLIVEGLFTHFARSDEPERPETHQQLERFCTLLRAVEESGMRPSIVHAANSAAALYFPESRFDMVRCGIAIYGLSPENEIDGLPAGFRPAATWKARLTSVKTLPPGSGIGYGHHYITRGSERIGVISAGYADGFRRRLGNFVLAGGQRVPVRGGVCMDQCMIALDSVPEAKIGDEVVLIGRQGNSRITAEEVGAEWSTINYEVVCGLANRLPRFYRE
ncbi:MAG TPA: alanine racemase [Levilinea sp.]|nr:alanine racemase [Levilinea sp.]